jgi:hypothetical protein
VPGESGREMVMVEEGRTLVRASPLGQARSMCNIHPACFNRDKPVIYRMSLKISPHKHFSTSSEWMFLNLFHLQGHLQTQPPTFFAFDI